MSVGRNMATRFFIGIAVSWMCMFTPASQQGMMADKLTLSVGGRMLGLEVLTMGVSLIKSLILSLVLELVRIPTDIIGKWLLSHEYVTAASQATISYTIGTLAACLIWAKVMNTQTIRDMSGIVTKEDADRYIRTAIAMPEDASVQEVKNGATALKGEK